MSKQKKTTSSGSSSSLSMSDSSTGQSPQAAEAAAEASAAADSLVQNAASDDEDASSELPPEVIKLLSGFVDLDFDSEPTLDTTKSNVLKLNQLLSRARILFIKYKVEPKISAELATVISSMTEILEDSRAAIAAFTAACDLSSSSDSSSSGHQFDEKHRKIPFKFTPPDLNSTTLDSSAYVDRMIREAQNAVPPVHEAHFAVYFYQCLSDLDGGSRQKQFFDDNWVDGEYRPWPEVKEWIITQFHNPSVRLGKFMTLLETLPSLSDQQRNPNALIAQFSNLVHELGYDVHSEGPESIWGSVFLHWLPTAVREALVHRIRMVQSVVGFGKPQTAIDISFDLAQSQLLLDATLLLLPGLPATVGSKSAQSAAPRNARNSAASASSADSLQQSQATLGALQHYSAGARLQSEPAAAAAASRDSAAASNKQRLNAYWAARPDRCPKPGCASKFGLARHSLFHCFEGPPADQAVRDGPLAVWAKAPTRVPDGWQIGQPVSAQQ